MKKINKIFISIPILAITPVLTLAATNSCTKSISAKRADGTDWEGLTQGSFAKNDYLIDDEKETITYINSVSIHAYNLVIPDYVKLNNRKLKVLIGERCFKNNIGIAGTIRLNTFIREIPKECFLGCSSLIGVICIKNLLRIENWAFANAPLLSHIYILQDEQLNPDWSSEISYIGDFAFYKCIGLSGNIVLGTQCNYVGQYAFNYCASLEEVGMQFCNMIFKINQGCFASSGIKQLWFPPNLQCIEKEAFKWCDRLDTINVPVTGMKLTLGTNAFFGCQALRRFTNRIKIEEIGPGCFSFNKHINFPVWEPEYGLEEIPCNTFSSCGFSSLKFYPDGPSNIGDYAFSDNKELNYIDFSAYAVEDGIPQWKGRHIFEGANPQGGTILLSERNRFSHEWQEFLNQNDIDTTKWQLRTAQQPFIKVTSPAKTDYIVTVHNGSGSVTLDPFTYTSEDNIEQDLFSSSFHPRSSDEKQKATFKKTHWKLDTQKKTITLTLDIIDATNGTFTGTPNFFYGTTKILTDSVKFKIVIQNI